MNQVAVKENTSPTQNQMTRTERFIGALDGERNSIVALLGNEAYWDKFRESAILAAQKRPELLHCGTSFLLALRDAAKTGLIPDGKLAHIEIYNTKVGDKWEKTATFMPMGKGWQTLAQREGYHVITELIYSNDKFKYNKFTDNLPYYEPDYSNRGEFVSVVAAFIPANGGKPTVEIIPKSEVDKIKECAKTKNVWNSWYEEKAKNAAIKRGAKRLHLEDSKLQIAVELDDNNFDLEKLNSAQSRPALQTNLNDDWATPTIENKPNNQEEDSIDEEGEMPDGYGIADYSFDVGSANDFREIADATARLIASEAWANMKVDNRIVVLKTITSNRVNEIGLPAFTPLDDMDDAIYLSVLFASDDLKYLNNVDDLHIKQQGVQKPEILSLKNERIKELKGGGNDQDTAP